MACPFSNEFSSTCRRLAIAQIRAIEVAGSLAPWVGYCREADLAWCGWLRGAAGTAKTCASWARLSASGAVETRGGCGLLRPRGCCHRSLRIRGDRPDQRDDPADNGPAGKNVQDQDGGEVGFVARKKCRQKVQEKRHRPKDGVEMKERDEAQRRGQHDGRSVMTVFYHEFGRFASRRGTFRRCGRFGEDDQWPPVSKSAPLVFYRAMYSIGLPRNGVLLQMRRGLQFFKKTHGHLRRRRPPATDTTSRLRFALPREHRSQDDWAAIFVPCAV